MAVDSEMYKQVSVGQEFKVYFEFLPEIVGKLTTSLGAYLFLGTE